MIKNNKKIIYVVVLFLASIFVLVGFGSKQIIASNQCIKSITNSIKEPGDSEYYYCDPKTKIYMIDDEQSSSSYFSLGFDEDGFMYSKNETEQSQAYYVKSLYIVAKGYDDSKLFGVGNNKWIKVYRNDAIIYDGYFRDTFGDQSYTKKLPLYTLPGIYKIEQYINDVVLPHCFFIINLITIEDTKFSMNNAFFGEQKININASVNNLIKIGSGSNLSFEFAKSEYGIKKEAEVFINDNYENPIKTNVIIGKEDYKIILDKTLFMPLMITNNTASNPNTITIVLKSNADIEKAYVMKFIFREKSLTIKLTSLKEDYVVTSKKIDILSAPGIDNELKTESCLYFWSRDPMIPLTKESFIDRYNKSKDRGKYVSGSGVIIREKNGNYYLYVLAEDNVNSVVVKSEAIKLKSLQEEEGLSTESIIFTLFIITIAAVPIVVFTFIKSKSSK